MLPLLSFVMLLSAASGSDVVLGIVGKSAFIECQLPVTSTLAWQTMDGYIIAVDGKVTNENNTKYVIEKQATLRESLVVRDLTLADDTSYKCFDLNNAAVYDITKLNILARPLRMNLTSPRNSLLEGTTVNFTCEADGGKPQPEIDWFIKFSNGTVRQMSGNVEDKTYINGTGHRVNILTIEVTREMFGATITCNISVSILFQETLTVDTNVLLAPRQPVITGYDGSFDEDTVMSIVCSSNGSLPTASVYWLLDGNKVGDVEVVVKPEENGTFLVVSHFQRLMSRDYNGSVLSCAVTNDVLRDRRMPPLMTSVILLASYKPEVTRQQEEYMVEQHGNVTLSCYIQGNPAPRFEQLYWTQKDTVIDRKYYKLSNDSDIFSLVLNNVDVITAGNFSCHAENRLGTATSQPISLQVLYVPFCSSNVVEKHAVRIGKSVQLNCNMEAVPSNVLFTWRYETSQEIILANQSLDNLSNDNIAHGTLDLKLTSQSQYNVIECRGRNSVGMSIKPCRFNIVPPGPPDAPSNCSTETNGVHITVKCNIGFDGGSTQHFVLQKLRRSQYETILTQNQPSFTFDSYQNVTIRVCAFNDDYRFSPICDIPSSVVVDIPDQPQSDEVKGGNSHRTAYIAGGVVASLGFIIIAILLVVLYLRRHKKDLSLEKDDSAENKVSKSKMLREWWKRNVSRQPFTKDNANPPRSITSSIRGGEAVIEADTETKNVRVPYLDIVVQARNSLIPHHSLNYNHLVSTPRHNSKCPELRTTVDTNADIEMGQLDQAPNVLSESTGFALSPIHNENSIRYLDEVTEIHSNVNTADYDTKYEGISNCYNTHDILEGLSDSKDSQGAKYGAAEFSKSKTLTKTLDEDYSCGDIVDALDQILDKTDSGNIGGDEIDTKTENEATICGRHMSSLEDMEDIEDSVTILKFRNRQTNIDATEEVTDEPFCNGSQCNIVSITNGPDDIDIDNSDVSATVLCFARSSPNTSASMINNISISTTYQEDKPVLLRSPLRASMKRIQNKTVRCLEKSYSLPYRSKNRNRQNVTKTNSTSDLNNDKLVESSDLTAFHDRYGNKSNSKFPSDNTSSTTVPEESNASKSDTDSTMSNDSTATRPKEIACGIDELSLTLESEPNDTINSNMSKPSFISTLTDASEMLCDVDEYTLTISEPGHEHGNTSRLNDASLRDIDEFTLTITSEQSTVFESPDNLDEDDESREALQLMSSTRSFEDSLGYDRNVIQPRDIHRRESFLSAIINNSAFENDEGSIDTSSKRQSSASVDTETESSYFNHGFDMDSESTLDGDDTKQSDLEQDTNAVSNTSGVDLDKSEDSNNVVLYI